MPFFLQNNRQKESTEKFDPRDSRHVDSIKKRKSNAALNGGPRDAAWPASRKFHGPSLQPRVPFSSPALIQPCSATTVSAPGLEPVRKTVHEQGLGIGIAIGSPTETPPNAFGFPLLDDASRIESISEHQETRAECLETSESINESPIASKVTRWKTVGGLFARRKVTNQVLSPMDRISEDSASTTESPAARASEDKPHRSLHLKRSRKPRLAPPSLKDDCSTSDLVLTPGEARAFETSDPDASPALDVTIPQPGLDRYSVMFSKLLSGPCNEPRQPRQSLLARRQGVESLTITSPGFAPTANVESHASGNVDQEDIPRQAIPEPEESARAFPLATHSSQFRMSAMPAPLFSKKEHHTHQLKKSQSAIGLQSVTGSSAASLDQISTVVAEPAQPATYPSTPRLAFLADSPPDSPSPDAGVFSHRDSSISTASSNNYPPSPSSSTYSFSFPTSSAASLRSPPLGTFPIPPKYPPPPLPASTDPAASSPHYLSVPTPTSSFASPVPPSTPWSEHLASVSAFPSPLLPSSPSPRLKYGYDGAHSPLLALARTVTVSVRAGRGNPQRPQFVVRERGSGATGVCAAHSAVLVQ